MNRPAGSSDPTIMGDGGGDGESAEVVLYTLSGCGACSLARRILRRRGIDFEEVRGDGVPRFRRLLRERTGRLTVPQVVVDGEPIGGADTLAVLDRRRVLVPLVRRERFPVAVVRRRFSPIRLLAATLGGGCEPWRYRVELVERAGRVLARGRAGSREEATAIAGALREEFVAQSAVG